MNKLLFVLLMCVAVGADAQKADREITPENFLRLQQYEDTLRWLGDSVVQSADPLMREQACVVFLKTLVRALKVENSYQYPFDSLRTISTVYDPDNSFRIITWQLTFKDMSYRYYGTIQMDEPQLKMYPLIDMSLFIGTPQDTMLSKNSWYGCIYYNVVKKQYKKQTYYLLFGWDANDMFSNKKMIEVLTFDRFGEPVFGAPIFMLEKTPEPQTRVIIEYKEDAAAVLNYDEKEKMIIVSYMRPENPMSEGIYFTYIPDGTYVGFKFKRGYWRYQNMVFDRTMRTAPDYTPQHQGEDPWMYEKKEPVKEKSSGNNN